MRAIDKEGSKTVTNGFIGKMSFPLDGNPSEERLRTDPRLNEDRSRSDKQNYHTYGLPGKRRTRAAGRSIVFLLAVFFLFLLTPGAYAVNMVCGDCHVSQHGGITCPDCTTCHTGLVQGVNHHTGAGHTVGSSTCIQCHTTIHPGPVVPGPCSTCHAVEATAPLNHRTGTGTPATCTDCHTEPGVQALPNNLNITCWQCHGGGTNPADNPPRYPILWLSDASLAARASGIHWVRPDMVISYLSLSATQTWPGASISVIDSTKNRGGGPAGASTTAFSLSGNATCGDGDDVLLSPARSVPALAYNETSTGTTSVTIPGGTAAGAYYICAKADNGGVVAEFDETNNARLSDVLSIVANNVDLVVASGFAPASAKKGTNITLTDMTKNRLTDAAGASTTAAYLSATCTASPSGSPIGSRAVGPLAGGASNSGSFSALIPLSTTAGSYSVIWKADNGGVVMETDETNNTRCKAITITN